MTRQGNDRYSLMVINVKYDHNPNYIFQTMGSILLTTTQEGDLGVTTIYPLIEYCVQYCLLYPKERNFSL